jgi:glutamate-1-semialdehyde 2,1-aminomutase
MSIHDELFARARGVLPGGVNSPVRAFRAVGGHPLYVKSAEGAYLHGEGGETWVDFCRAWGPSILGHAHPGVVEAVTRAARDGLCFGTVTRAEVDLGERILSAFPGHERVRLLCSGTEAVMTALRLARGATGRPAVLKFSGCYHGHADGMLVRAGSGLVTFGVGDSAGVPPGAASDTLVAPLDDEGAVDEAFRAHGDRIAAVIVEPLPANNGLLVQRREWLAHLRAACDRHGALLILDEVITGLRFGWHGYGHVAGIRADLTTLGKIVGGGMPLAAVAGSAAVLDRLAPEGPVYQAGTMAGNPVAVAAGIATLDALRDGTVHAHLDRLGAALDDAARRGRVTWVRQGSIAWPHLGPGDPPRRDDRLDPESRPVYARMFAAWLDAGIYMPPSAFEVAFLCAAHTEAQVRRLVEVAEHARAA